MAHVFCIVPPPPPPSIDCEAEHLLKKKKHRQKRGYCKIHWHRVGNILRTPAAIYLISSKRKELFESLPELLPTGTKKFCSSFKPGFKQSTVPNKMTWTRCDSTKIITATNPGDVANLLKDYFYSVFKPPCTSSECVSNLQPPTCIDSTDNTL